MNLCRTINETPVEELDTALEPLVDIDNLLWFLALDVSLINNDGYWVRASDYSIYLAENGKFQFVPHDMNEAFNGAMSGPGMGGPAWVDVVAEAAVVAFRAAAFQVVQAADSLAVHREISPQLEDRGSAGLGLVDRVSVDRDLAGGGFPGGGGMLSLIRW